MQERTSRLLETCAALSSPSSFALSPNGESIAFINRVGSFSQIFISALSGGWNRRLIATLSDCDEPQWTPDGKRLVFVSENALWIVNADGTDAKKLTEHPSGNRHPRWSPDGSRIAFYSRRRGWDHVWTIPADGGEVRQILKGECDYDDMAWSPDSKWLAYCSVREEDLSTRAVFIISSDGGEEQVVSPVACWSGAPHFSPDGKTLAYLSDHDGWFHIYLFDLHTRETCQITRGEFEVGGPYFYNVDPRGGPASTRYR